MTDDIVVRLMVAMIVISIHVIEFVSSNGPPSQLTASVS